jgi:hypothetical protein
MPPDRPIPSTSSRPAVGQRRTGDSTIERQAIARTRLEIASMPASDVAQLALWPDQIAGWARSVQVSTSVVYNMLGRVKPYRRVRELLAHRLDVPTYVLDHLVDAGRPLPHALRPPDPDRPAQPPSVRPRSGSAGADSADDGERAAADVAALLLPGIRDGSNPLERRAVFRVETEIAALPASLVVQLALYPESLASWARRQQVPAPMLYSTLSAGQSSQRIRDALARRLGVTMRELDALIAAVRPEPRATLPPTVADEQPPSALPQDGSSGPAPSPAASSDQEQRDQLGFGI